MSNGPVAPIRELFPGSGFTSYPPIPPRKKEKSTESERRKRKYKKYLRAHSSANTNEPSNNSNGLGSSNYNNNSGSRPRETRAHKRLKRHLELVALGALTGHNVKPSNVKARRLHTRRANAHPTKHAHTRRAPRGAANSGSNTNE